jgi:plastocyanin
MALLIVLISMSGSCKKSSDTPGPNEVFIQGMAFSPASITVSVNTTITWTNKDGIAHTVTSNTGLFDSGNMNSGAIFSRQFTTAGTFPYHCTYHPTMTATITVQ